MKKLFNKTNLIALLMVVTLVVPTLALANANLGLDTASSIGLGNADAKNVVVNLIRVVLGFLGLIAVVIILIGGFMWMTAGGNEDKVTKGRKYIINGAIGLVIVLGAFSIATFVISQINGSIR